ncbi:MAG: hypothetical protein HY735_19215 [Verrucomicrobia bacterium]|nr:hypothetical protein [Verrucomicrobiota bacterium]
MLIKTGDAPAFFRRVTACRIGTLQHFNRSVQNVEGNIRPPRNRLASHVNHALVSQFQKILEHVAGLPVFRERRIENLDKHAGVKRSHKQDAGSGEAGFGIFTPR